VDRFETQLEAPHFHLYRWADYFEVLTLWNPDREMSTKDFTDRIKPKFKDLLLKSINGDGNPDAPDGWENKLDRVLTLLRTRSLRYGASYPFSLDGKSLVCNDAYTDQMNLYIYLLCSSSLLYFKDIMPQLTSGFETISYLTVGNLVPSNSSIFIAGKNMLGGAVRYTGNKNVKIRAMADDLGVSLVNPKHFYPPNDNGDAGVDIIGWRDFSDGEDNKVIFIGQSKCSPKWSDGRKDALALLEGVFAFNSEPSNFYFIPLCFRASDFSWANPDALRKIILVDRFRIIDLLTEQEITKFVGESPAMARITELLNTPIEAI
jgi:hypothetical protein